MKIDIKNLIKEEILKLSIEEAWSGKVEHYEIDTSETTQEYKTQKAIESFQGQYRSLDIDTRYFFTQWLRKAILKKISYEEANEIATKIIASSKGYVEPEDKNQ
jgi:hypothetical protein